MNNGVEVFAKLPNPSAGPAYVTTASEVATRTFLRDVLNIPTPRILAWSADNSNPVGAEYILEEKAAGQALGSLWVDWSMKHRTAIIEEVVKMERKLTESRFHSAGCIYFSDDGQTGGLIKTDPPLPSAAQGRFKMGPLVSQRLWRGNRASMELDRGPFHQPIDYATAMARNEMKYIKKYGHARMNYHRSSTVPQLPEEAILLLERYLQVAHDVEPPPTQEDTHSPRLWHPDLHLDNIFVDPDSKQITNIIDWQGATVLPLYYQCGIPVAFEHYGPAPTEWAIPDLPEDFDSLSPQEQASAQETKRSKLCHIYYESKTSVINPTNWAAMCIDQLELRVKPVHYAAGGLWKNQHLYFFRQALIAIAKGWTDLCPSAGPCPFEFGETELALQQIEDERMNLVLGVLSEFLLKLGLFTDGRVEVTQFDQMLIELNKLRETYLSAADDAEERLLMERLWPYQDGDRHGRLDTESQHG